MQEQLFEGVTLEHQSTKQFKTVAIMIDFVTTMTPVAATQRALLAQVLETSSQQFPTQTALARELSRLYGATFGINVLKAGNRHIVRVTFSGVNERYLTTFDDPQPLFEQGVLFLKQVLFAPLLREGQFEAQTFSRQRHNLKAAIDSLVDDKQYLASLRLRQLLAQQDPDVAVGALGTVDRLQEVTNADLVAAYHQMMTEDTIHVTVSGDLAADRVRQAFISWPFGDRLVDQRPPFQMIAPLKTVVRGEDRQQIVQAKFHLAYRLPIIRGDQDYLAAVVMNAIFGGSPLSLLFTNVREKASLAYYASSNYSPFTGLLTVQTGIQAQNAPRVANIVDQQLAAIATGDLAPERLQQVQSGLVNARLAALDSQRRQLEAQLNVALTGIAYPVDEWVTAIQAVTIDQVAAVAQKAALQGTYLLRGED